MRRAPIGAGFAALLAACTAPVLERPPTGALERALLLREAAEDGWHGISDPDPMGAAALRVLEPAPVDPDSRLELLPDAEALAEAAREAGADPAGARLRLEAYVQRPGHDPAPLHLPGYDSIDRLELDTTPRAIGEAPATALDLSRGSVRAGDRLLVRAGLEDADGRSLGEPAEFRARLQQYGWSSAYHPSVVLAKPGYPGQTEADFRFTPGVAWLHAYTPRHDESGAWADWMRATRMSAGPHAMLLQFDTEDEVEIGLGVTLGFWDGVLQLGFGYNMMANHGQDRQYVYVGSSMIALAQAGQRSFGALAGF